MYEKRLCILKQLKKGFSADGSPLSGAIYLERFGKELIVTPKIVGLSPLRDGRYALALKIAEREYCLELCGNASLRIPDSPAIGGGFSALVCFVREKAEPVAFGCCGGAANDPKELLSVFSRKSAPLKSDPPQNSPHAPETVRETPQSPLRASETARERLQNSLYASGTARETPQNFSHASETVRETPQNSPQVPEAVRETPQNSLHEAETDWERPQNPLYAPGNEISGGEKLSESAKQTVSAPQYDDEAIASSDYYHGEGSKDGQDGVAAEELQPESGEAETEEEEPGGSVHPFSLPRGNLAYYRSVAARIADAMNHFPRDETLQKTFPQSQWVKTQSGLLGVIYAQGLPRYLCVAMKDEPPKEVRDQCVFVPESPFDDTVGYFVVFQDADTGDYVKVENG